MKQNQRLDYSRLADAVIERGLIEPSAVQHVLDQCSESGELMPELLVRENLISDWELARLVCEVFGLAFLPVDSYEPSLDACEGLDRGFLHEHGLVPLDLFGSLMTVAMPGLVPTEVLGSLSEKTECRILPVVGTVASNRSWLEEHLPLQAAAPAPAAEAAVDEVAAPLPASLEDESWGDLFDAADAAVQHSLTDEPKPALPEGPAMSLGIEPLPGGTGDSEGVLDLDGTEEA